MEAPADFDEKSGYLGVLVVSAAEVARRNSGSQLVRLLIRTCLRPSRLNQASLSKWAENMDLEASNTANNCSSIVFYFI